MSFTFKQLREGREDGESERCVLLVFKLEDERVGGEQEMWVASKSWDDSLG